MNYTPQQLAQALQLYSSMGAQGEAPAPRTPLSPMQVQAPPSGGSPLDPAGLMKMFGGLMGGGGGTPPNPYAMGAGAYMDAGSMPMFNMA